VVRRTDRSLWIANVALTLWKPVEPCPQDKQVICHYFCISSAS